MPLVQGRKRRSVSVTTPSWLNDSLIVESQEPEVEEPSDSSPEPATQRRRTTNLDSDNEEFTGDATRTAIQGDHEEMVKKLVRLALACEYQRRPIRRIDVGEKVLGNHGRQFKQVFEDAQRRLREVFGMEMVELPAKDKVTLQQRRGTALIS